MVITNKNKINKIIVYKESNKEKTKKKSSNKRIKINEIIRKNKKIFSEGKNFHKNNIYKKEFNNKQRKEIKKVNININNKKTNNKKSIKLTQGYIFHDKSKMNNLRNYNINMEKQIIIKYTRNNKIYIKIIVLLVLLNLFIQTLLNKHSNILKISNSNITLKIKGIGYKNIFGIHVDNFFETQYYPSKIYINGNKRDIINHTYYFNLTENFVELIWNLSITNCKNMFRRCFDITEINLFHFDTSKVTIMLCMFFYCSSLTSINLSNIDTSNVDSMAGMFQICYSLTSLDLSSFNTSKLRYMGSMFTHCHSLTSLNLSNFKTSNIREIEYIFAECQNLEYLNLKNFNESLLNSYHSMFKNINDNIVICINENINSQKILPQIKNISCYIINCSDDWKTKQR